MRFETWTWYALGSAFFAALTAILAKAGVTGVNANVATWVRTVVILALTSAVVTGTKAWPALASLPRGSLRMLVLSGAATGLSWLCYFQALQRAPASQVAPIDKLSVGLVAVLGVLLLGEPLSWRLAVGVTLIVTGVLVVASGGSAT
jgi:transporter family protein